jgi:Domain of unknown function (DUF4388)
MARRRRDAAETPDLPSAGTTVPEAAASAPVGSSPSPDHAPLGATPIGKEPFVSHSSPLAGGPVPSLVGSLSVFDLGRVLSWLAAGSQTGELRIEGDDVDGRIWVLQGELSNAQVGTASTIGQAIFELARINDGSFQYTEGPVSSSGEVPVPVATILAEVRADVEEWRAIRRVVPGGAVVTLCPDPPGHDIKIRSDQWHVLTSVGAGNKTVEELLGADGGDQMVALRALRDLHLAGLITIEARADSAAVIAPRRGSAPEAANITPSTAHNQESPNPAAEPQVGQAVGRPEASAKGAPASEVGAPGPDPWATLAKTNPSSDNGVA